MSQGRASMRVSPGGGGAGFNKAVGRASILNKGPIGAAHKGVGVGGSGGGGRSSILHKGEGVGLIGSNSNLNKVHPQNSLNQKSSDGKTKVDPILHDYGLLGDEEEEQESTTFLKTVRLVSDFIDEPHSVYEWIYHLSINLVNIVYIFIVSLETADGPNYYEGRKDESRFPFLPDANQYYILKLCFSLPLMVHIVVKSLCSICLLKKKHIKEFNDSISFDIHYFFDYCSTFQADALLLLWFSFQIVVRFTKAWPYDYRFSMLIYFIIDYLRFLQFFKSFRNISSVTVVSNALRRIISVISAPIFVFFCFNIIFGGFIYTFDPCYDNSVCPFPNLLQATFFCVVSMTTTGYGNQSPTLCYSQLFAIGIMLCGAPYLAIPIGIIDVEFSESYEEEQENENEKKRILQELSQDENKGNIGDEEEALLLAEDDDVKTVEFRKGRILNLYVELSEQIYLCVKELESFKDVLEAEFVQDKFSTITSIYNHNNYIFQKMAFQLSRLQKLCSVFSGEVGIICGLSGAASGDGGKSGQFGRRGAASFVLLQQNNNDTGNGEANPDREKRLSAIDPKSENSDTVVLLQKLSQEATSHPLKSSVRLFVECPASSTEATAYNFLIIGCVLVSIVLLYWQTMISFIPHGEDSSICADVVKIYCDNKYNSALDPGCFVHSFGSVTESRLKFGCHGPECYGYSGNFGSKVNVTCNSEELLPFRTSDLLEKVTFSADRVQFQQNFNICNRLECSDTTPLIFDANTLWLGLESFINVVFVIDLGLHLFLASSVKDFVYNVMNIVDCLAIVPYFFEFIEALVAQRGMIFNFLSSTPDLRVASLGKLLKVFRVLKLFRKFKGGQIVAKVILLSWKDIFRFYSIVLLIVACYGILLHYSTNANVCYYNQDCPEMLYFQEKVVSMQFSTGQRVLYRDDLSLPFMYNALYGAWFSAVTLTTTGYGDLLPQSPQSYVLAVILMLFGTFFTAIPLSIVNRNFQTYYTLMKNRERTKSVAFEGLIEQRNISKKEKQFKKRVTEVTAKNNFILEKIEKEKLAEEEVASSTNEKEDDDEEDENNETPKISADKIQREFDKILKEEKLKKIKVPQEDYRVVIKDYSSYSAHISVENKRLLNIMTAQSKWQKMRTSVQSLIKLKSFTASRSQLKALMQANIVEENEEEEDEDDNEDDDGDGDKLVGDDISNSSINADQNSSTSFTSGEGGGIGGDPGSKASRKSIRASRKSNANSFTSPSKLLPPISPSKKNVGDADSSQSPKKSEIEELLKSLTSLKTLLETLNQLHLSHSYKIRYLSGIEKSRGQISSNSRDLSIISLLKSSLTKKQGDLSAGSAILKSNETQLPSQPSSPSSSLSK